MKNLEEIAQMAERSVEAIQRGDLTEAKKLIDAVYGIAFKSYRGYLQHRSEIIEKRKILGKQYGNILTKINGVIEQSKVLLVCLDVVYKVIRIRQKQKNHIQENNNQGGK